MHNDKTGKITMNILKWIFSLNCVNILTDWIGLNVLLTFPIKSILNTYICIVHETIYW